MNKMWFVLSVLFLMPRISWCALLRRPLKDFEQKMLLRDMGNTVPPELHDVAFVVKKDKHHPAILLHGSPGLGKSMMAKALAATIGWQFVRVKGSFFASTYQDGQTVGFQKFIERIENEGVPVVLCIDECGPLLNKLEDKEGKSRESLLSEMKTFLEDCNDNRKRVPILVVATTNDYKKIDDAIQSRLNDNMYEIKAPTDDEREKIIAGCMVRLTGDAQVCATRAVLIKKLSQYSKKLSIRDIVGYMKKAHRFAIASNSLIIKDHHFYHGLSALLSAKIAEEKKKSNGVIPKWLMVLAGEIVVRVIADQISSRFFGGYRIPEGKAVEEVGQTGINTGAKIAVAVGTSIGAGAGWRFRDKIAVFYGHVRRRVWRNDGEIIDGLELQAHAKDLEETKALLSCQKKERQKLLDVEKTILSRQVMGWKINRMLYKAFTENKGIRKDDFLIKIQNYLDEARLTVGVDEYELIVRRIDDYYKDVLC